MLTIATWNLENFFRPGTGAGPTSQAAYDAKVAHLRATIGAIAPDVLGVQEVGQPEALEDLRGALGVDWHAITSQHPDGRGIRVGFLSRLPFAEDEDVVPFPDVLKPIQQSDDGELEHEMGRGALRARVVHDATDAQRATIGVHRGQLLGAGPRGAPTPPGPPIWTPATIALARGPSEPESP